MTDRGMAVTLTARSHEVSIRRHPNPDATLAGKQYARRTMTEKAKQSLKVLLEGNERFRAGTGATYRYEPHHRKALVEGAQPIAAVVTCVDSRVVPEVFFDQPLGSIFVSRVPANVASDSAKWMIDIAVGEFSVPLVIVLGHTGCVAVRQVLEGKSGPGGPLRFKVQTAVSRASGDRPEDLYLESIKENAKLTVEQLQEESSALRDALRAGKTSALAGLYNMESGAVEILQS